MHDAGGGDPGSKLDTVHDEASLHDPNTTYLHIPTNSDHQTDKQRNTSPA